MDEVVLRPFVNMAPLPIKFTELINVSPLFPDCFICVQNQKANDSFLTVDECRNRGMFCSCALAPWPSFRPVPTVVSNVRYVIVRPLANTIFYDSRRRLVLTHV